jgi:hypothetical protein
VGLSPKVMASHRVEDSTKLRSAEIGSSANVEVPEKPNGQLDGFGCAGFRLIRHMVYSGLVRPN